MEKWLQTLPIRLRKERDNTYDIIIGSGLTERTTKAIGEMGFGRVVVLCDTNTGPLFRDKLGVAFEAYGIDTLMIEVKSGEDSKNLCAMEDAIRQMYRSGITRADGLLAFGGGVVGDLGGFMAGSYMRGIPFIQCPTTLLSQVDSAVGGKVAVNIPEAKNYVGLFNQPKAVFADIDYLDSLPEKEFANGLAEVVKYAFLDGGDLSEFLHENRESTLRRDHRVLSQLVSRCCTFKAWVVEQDETEADLRMILNFGHTVGHAIEAHLEYTLPHGSCVAYGMRIMLEAACAEGGLPKAERNKGIALLDAFNLGLESLCINVHSVRKLLLRDKKNSLSGLRFIVPTTFGNVVVRDDFPETFVISELGKYSTKHD